ncbi:hypothetical protein [Desulfofundulus thermosubterraneus]|uniref:DUF4007 domain-containing protein n=1 Tax=Desulfofundulus thermosubterraneus DSM 16057 TaxID=1121432 RepID=A0A1M6LML5_9FIRM|nr:hypothetical protein [Desulfofundulus thermosubterraneus]SHJ72413.1 hypothetical protein SAMN02745219_03190 [Desulfofundulus thermosubterraneus DSM 16057]
MLPVNFHKTFVPERRLIAALLDYAALGKQGNFKEISSETGIPMGESTGKVPAILDYARGMGLIEIASNKASSVKKPVLTSFGKVVYLEDKFLGEQMVQWLAHMNLCRSDIGAKTWHEVFAKGRSILGTNFTKRQLEDYLISVCGPGNDRTGPLVSVYTEDAALGRSGVLTVKGEIVTRKKAPIFDAYAIPYSAYILCLMEAFFPRQEQVTFSDFNSKTFWFDICLWNQSDIEYVFSLVERKGFVSIDRQMQPWIIEKKAMADEVWPHIYDDMA